MKKTIGVRLKEIAGRANLRELGILYALLLLWAVLFITNPTFRKTSIYYSILREASFSGICGVGMTLCIASRHFDQSIASMLAFLSCIFTAIVPAMALRHGVPGFLLAILVVVAAGAALGAVNGVLVAKLRIPAFITTLGTLYVYRSLAYVVSDGQPVILNQIVSKEQYEVFRFISGRFLGLPFPFWIMLICAAVGTIILRKTALGRNILAIGNSVEASRIAGVNIDLTKMLVFVLVGLFVGVGTILNTAFLGSSNFGMSAGFEFVVISTVVLGGTALAGGKGSVFTTVIAAIFLVTVKAGMNAFHIDSFAQDVVQGFILLFAFSINSIRAILESYSVKARARREQKIGMAASQS